MNYTPPEQPVSEPQEALAQQQQVQNLLPPEPGFTLPDPLPGAPDESATITEERAEQLNQKEALLAAAEQIELWHDQEQEAHATILQGTGVVHCRIRSKTFKSWLCCKVFQDYKCAPGGQPLEDVLRVLEAKAKFHGQKFDTPVRMAGDTNTSYLHLADEAGTIFEISAQGVGEAVDTSIKFLTKPGMRQLPIPIVPKTIEEATYLLIELRAFCNLQEADDWLLFLTALLSALRPYGPFVVILVVGEQGSAKSTLCKILRLLVDPSVAPLRSAPREERDLWIAARNGWIIVFDNVSEISKDLSDSICRLATGGGNSYRTLFEDDAETLFQAQRLVVLNTIDDLALRGDAVDRSIQLTCQTIDPSKRRAEEEFWATFEPLRAKFLGALLLVLSHVLDHLPNVKLDRSPRMADFARFGVAVEKALGLEDGSFISAYEKNRKGLTAAALETRLAELILELELPIKTSATKLWEQLRRAAGLPVDRATPKWFPVNGQQLSSELRRLAPSLRQQGIEITFGKSGTRSITLSAIPILGVSTDSSNASDAPIIQQTLDLQSDAVESQHAQHASTSEIALESDLGDSDASGACNSTSST